MQNGKSCSEYLSAPGAAPTGCCDHSQVCDTIVEMDGSFARCGNDLALLLWSALPLLFVRASERACLYIPRSREAIALPGNGRARNNCGAILTRESARESKARSRDDPRRAPLGAL